ncbi:MAG: 50S ribosomal protein L29 [Bacteroidia bacterium]|jgi:large subunit ribosomal protein L29|nr:50S ribosomal protein L29 [Bacteroidia bacterium]
MKNKDIISLTEQELIERVKEAQAALNKQTLNHTISPVENPSSIRNNRRTVARMLTELSKRKNSANK